MASGWIGKKEIEVKRMEKQDYLGAVLAFILFVNVLVIELAVMA